MTVFIVTVQWSTPRLPVIEALEKVEFSVRYVTKIKYPVMLHTPPPPPTLCPRREESSHDLVEEEAADNHRHMFGIECGDGIFLTCPMPAYLGREYSHQVTSSPLNLHTGQRVAHDP